LEERNVSRPASALQDKGKEPATPNVGYHSAMIKRLYVHNFRCLENFELPISERSSSLLIGRNGTGKSTVGSVLEVFQSIARGTNRVGQLVRPSDFARGRSDVPLRFEIEAMIGGNVYGYTLALELPDGFRELRVFEEKLAVGGNPIYSRDGAQVQLTGTKKDKEAKFLVDWHLVALPVIQEQSTADPLYIFKTWLARMLILAPIPSLITGDSEGETLTPNRHVTDFGAWFSGLLAHSPAAYTQIDKYLKEVMPDFRDIKNPFRGTDFRSLTIQFQQDQATLSLPFRDLSDGEKCFFICAVALAANESSGPIFCFWDEPDNYLAPSEVGHFVMALRRSFQAVGQLLVTSHNPEAIRHFSDESILILHRQNHLEPTLVRPLSEVQNRGDLIGALIRNELEP
jgi:energy-coupling factor transporter ATP-binding protein EcfA2